jgi:subtilisin family serine protease
MNTWIIELGPGADPAEAVAALRGQPGIVRADLDHIGKGADVFPNDPRFAEQWGLDDAADTDIDAPAGWELTTGGPVLVALLDTGVDTDHPFLVGALEPGWDVVNADPDPEDDHGHGTAIASVIASRGNDGTGMAGICWQCRILPIKVLDENNEGYYSHWIQGIDRALAAGASVISMSMGGLSDDPGLEAAVDGAHSAGVVVVAAMMNDGDDTPYYPAAHASTIAVGATDPDGARASLLTTAGWASSTGGHIDLCAPGVDILAADLGGGSYAWSGTSLAVPMVTGAVALLLTLDPTLDPDSIRGLLRSTARDGEGRPVEDIPGWDPHHGAGRLDLDDLLHAAGGTSPEPADELSEPVDASTDTVDEPQGDGPAQGCGCTLVS